MLDGHYIHNFLFSEREYSPQFTFCRTWRAGEFPARLWLGCSNEAGRLSKFSITAQKNQIPLHESITGCLFFLQSPVVGVSVCVLFFSKLHLESLSDFQEPWSAVCPYSLHRWQEAPGPFWQALGLLMMWGFHVSRFLPPALLGGDR